MPAPGAARASATSADTVAGSMFRSAKHPTYPPPYAPRLIAAPARHPSESSAKYTRSALETLSSSAAAASENATSGAPFADDALNLAKYPSPHAASPL